MRLGQLSKQVETKPQNIVDFVKKIFDVEIKNHPNVKIQDEWENDIVAEFAKAVEVKEATEEVAKPIKVEAKELSGFEWELRQVVDVIDFKIISDTEKLYRTDKTFKKLVKAKKEATKQCELYINRHN